jgi:hypothetical protein
MTLLVCMAICAQARDAPRFEEKGIVQIAGDPVVSADGRWVAWGATVAELSLGGLHVVGQLGTGVRFSPRERYLVGADQLWRIGRWKAPSLTLSGLVAISPDDEYAATVGRTAFGSGEVRVVHGINQDDVAGRLTDGERNTQGAASRPSSLAAWLYVPNLAPA